MNFSGEFVNTIDAKGRASIPKGFRDALAAAGEEGLVVTRNREGGLTAYPPSEWEAFVGRIRQHPNGQARTRMNRLYLAPHTPVNFDAQGRVPLSKALRLWAGLTESDREVVVVGNFRRVDIYSQRRYHEIIGQDAVEVGSDQELVEELDLP